MTRWVHALGAIVILTALTGPCAAQHRLADLKEPFRGTYKYGEGTSTLFDEIITEATTSHAAVFVLSRLGAKEDRKYNNRRLHNALVRLVDYPSGLPRSQVIGAIGERTSSTGILEIYLGGVLVYVVDFEKNRDFAVDCCWEDEPSPAYYPDFKGLSKYMFP